MNILLIYPEFPDTFWSFKHVLKFTGHKAVSPPLGLLTVAAMLPPEWSKRLVDKNTKKVTAEDMEWADYAFISGMIVQRESARRAIAECKRAGVKVVAGGPLFTSEHEHFEEVDHFVLNEAELTLPPFLADLARGCAQRVYETSEFADLTKTPIPLWELVDLKQYLYVSIQFSRGCPFDCEFCNVTVLFGHRPRMKTTQQIIAELDDLYHSHGLREGIFLADDNFIGNKNYLKSELLPALIDWQKDKCGIPFAVEASINMADDEQLLRMMYEAGFDIIFIGIETPDEDGLTECNKVQNRNRDLVGDVRRIQRAGMQVQGGFIIGFDSDTPSIFKRQTDFIQKSGIPTATVGLLQAMPGTKLYERMARENRLLGPSFGDNVGGTTNIATKMDFDTLYEGYKNTLRYLYTSKNYYQRVRTLLKEYKTPKVKEPQRLKDVNIFLRSLFFFGFLDKGRFQFWRLLIWTLFHRPNMIPLVVAFAIQGYHFRRVCEQHVSSNGISGR
ncbi:MAG: DUF4070 domain-containing protein [Dehalococcoidia bacterium]|nr:DUF4070 domain-containing protein [Dehalococcoidia bacterium]